MQEKQARLTILIDPKSKKAFEKICSGQNITSSHMVRTLILDYLQSHDAGPAGKAKKSDALAYFSRRKEKEIVIDPAKVKIMSVEKLPKQESK